MDWSQSLRLIAPEETLSIAGLVLLLVAAWGGDRASRLISILAVAALVAAAFLVAPALCQGAMGPDASAFFGEFRADAFASYAKILIYLSAAASLVIAPAFFERFKAMRAEYPILILFAALGMGIMVSAGDLITLYIGLEMMSLSLYAMVAFDRDSVRATEASMKYFVLGALASGLLLYGMSMVYGATGSLEFAGIAQAIYNQAANQTVLVFGLVFLVAGICFKLGVVPFHMWVPDVYQGAPTAVTMVIASAPKLAAFAMAMRLLVWALFDLAEQWQTMLMLVALASIVLGNLAAIAQQNGLTSELSRNLHDAVKQVVQASDGHLAASTLIEGASAETERLREAVALLSRIGAALIRDVDSFSTRIKAA